MLGIESMQGMDLWRLTDELTISQAALLIAGRDPSEDYYVETWDVPERPQGYEAAKAAITNALRRGQIEGTIIPEFDYDINGNMCGEIKGTIDTKISRVEVHFLKSWLRSRGFKTGFFFPEGVDSPDYLDPTHPRYAPKLAAAVHAWLAVEDTQGKSPKQALEKWLREHAAQFSLTNDEGNPNATGIEEIAKVANWQPGGGAPKTPTA